MELVVVESKGKCVEELEVAPMGCTEFMVGCCIIHFWCWDAGDGLCC